MIFLSYLLKAAIIQVVLLGFYHIALRPYTFFQERRIYLLSALTLSLIIPLLHISGESLALYQATILPEYIVAEKNIAYGIDYLLTSTNWSLASTALIIYLIGATIFQILLIKNLHSIYKQFSVSTKLPAPNYNIYYSSSKLPCFSFFSNIFINKETLKGPATKQIIEHELIHVKQCHSADSLFIEVLNIVFWCLPVIRFYQKEIKLLHEFIADEHCVGSKEEHYDYSKLIMSQSLPKAYMTLTNPFSKLVFKKRIAMLSKTKSSNRNKIHFIWSLPVIAILLFSFSSANETLNIKSSDMITADTSKAYKVVDEMPEFQGGKTALYQFMMTNVHYPEVSKNKKEEGKVFVQFVVNKKGKITNAKVVSDSPEKLNEEALRVVHSMPDWKPGKHKGKNVAVEVTLPIHFKLPPPPSKEK